MIIVGLPVVAAYICARAIKVITSEFGSAMNLHLSKWSFLTLVYCHHRICFGRQRSNSSSSEHLDCDWPATKHST
jgi:hypothetical protein